MSVFFNGAAGFLKLLLLALMLMALLLDKQLSTAIMLRKAVNNLLYHFVNGYFVFRYDFRITPATIKYQSKL